MDQLTHDFSGLVKSFPLMLVIVIALWAVNIINWIVFKSYLSRFGVIPRRARGLIGIPISFMFHGNFNHLFFNSIPLLVLGAFILSQGLIYLLIVTIVVGVIESSMVWLIGRRGNHIGASGIITGYFGYLLIMAYVSPNITTIVLAVITMYYFGSILFSVIPAEPGMSWESHLFGMLAGMAVGKLNMMYDFGLRLEEYFPSYTFLLSEPITSGAI
ncbi:MAG: rhomboid family intramembrane serine protease [Francisellaceae bacterium]|nr:rhomboid family intramembrane serine protease [Francisellaceae bacterium]